MRPRFGLPSPRAIATALLRGRLVVENISAGRIILTTPERLRAARERREDLLLAWGGAIEEYDTSGRLVSRRTVGKFGWRPGSRPDRITFRARDLVGAIVAVQDAHDFRVFRRQWGAVLPAVTLRDIRAVQGFCRRCGVTATRAPRLSEAKHRDLRAQAVSHERAGLIYRALAAYTGPSDTDTARCRFCGRRFKPRGRVRDCCGRLACRRARERERWHRRYTAPAFRAQVKRRVVKWRRGRKTGQKPGSRIRT